MRSKVKIDHTLSFVVAQHVKRGRRGIAVPPPTRDVEIIDSLRPPPKDLAKGCKSDLYTESVGRLSRGSYDSARLDETRTSDRN